MFRYYLPGIKREQLTSESLAAYGLDRVFRSTSQCAIMDVDGGPDKGAGGCILSKKQGDTARTGYYPKHDGERDR